MIGSGNKKVGFEKVGKKSRGEAPLFKQRLS